MTWSTPPTGAAPCVEPHCLFLCALLFTVIWWDVDHHRSNWLAMFILLIVLSAMAAVYALRGVCDITGARASQWRPRLLDCLFFIGRRYCSPLRPMSR